MSSTKKSNEYLSETFYSNHATTATYEGGWLSAKCPSSVDGFPFMLRSADVKTVWLSNIEKSNDFVMAFYNKGYGVDENGVERTGKEILRISSETGDITAGGYKFGPQGTGISQNTIFKEIKGEAQLCTDTCYRVYVKDLYTPMLSIEHTKEMKLFSVNTEQFYLTATQWIQFDGTVNCNNNFVIGKKYYELKDNKYQASEDVLSWGLSVDYYDLNDPNRPTTDDKPLKNSKDLVLTLWDNRPLKEDTNYVKDGVKNFEAIRVSYDTGDICAVTGAFHGQGADLAEYYQADRGDYEPGTLMCHGVDTEVTLCQSIDQSDDFFGVVSTSPVYVMNGKEKDEPNSILIALNGKVPVKVKGVVKCGDKITIGQDGYGVVSTNKNDVIVGRAKENKATEDVGLVSCYVQAHM